jgi:putative protein-disulfide isomerase
VELHLVVGGLRTGSGAALEPTTRRYILEHWQAVTEATGQPFKFDGALPDGFVYDTEPACRAIVTARSLAPDCAWTLVGLIQQAFYAEGRDVTQASVLVELAERLACRASSLPPFRSRRPTRRDRCGFHLGAGPGHCRIPDPAGRAQWPVGLLTNGYQPLSELSPLLGRWLERAACA